MTADEHYQKGMEYFVLDQLDEAIAELQKALEQDSSHTDSLHAISMSCYHQKDLDNAIRYGERLRDADPENALAYTSLSMYYQAQGRIQDAEDMGALAAKYSGKSG